MHPSEWIAAYVAAYHDRRRTARRAREAVRAAIRSRSLSRARACEDCGVECVTEAHHPNYLAPLVVLWLCPRCHRQRHKRPASVLAWMKT